MKLRTLRLKNLRQHADTEVVFPPSGITGLVGPNESGKSTLLEGASWALYGSRAIRGNKSGLRWNRAPARHVASAALDFEVGGKTYRVERTESDAKLVEMQGGAALPIAEGTSAVDGYVPDLIGMELDEFSASYLCRQKDLSRMASMGPTERQKFIRGVMGLDRIDAALEVIRKRKNELAKELDGLAAGLGEREPLAGELADAEQLVALLADRRQELANSVAAAADDHENQASRLLALDQRKERHDQLKREADDAQREAERLERERERLSHLIEEADAASTRLTDAESKLAPLPGLRARRDTLLQAKERVEGRAQLEGIVDQVEAEVARLSKELEELDEAVAAHEEDALQQVAERYSELQEQADRLRKDREGERIEAKTQSDAAGAEREKIRRQIAVLQEAGADSPCPTCTRPLGEQLAPVVATLQEAAARADEACRAAARRALERSDVSEEESAMNLQALQLKRRGEQLKEVRTQAREAERRIGSVRMRIEQKRNELRNRREQLQSWTSVEFSPDALREVEEVIAALERFEREKVSDDRALVRRTPEIRIQLEEVEKGRARAVTAQETATEAVEALEYDPAAHATLSAEVEQLRAQLEEQRREHTAAEERYRAAEERRTRAARALEEYDGRAEKLGTLQEDVRVHATAADRLNGFRIEQASLIRPELEELTSGFISILTDGRHDSVTVTEDFGVVLQESGLDTEVVSGGTEDIAAIALRLAMSQMIAERAGHPLSLLILDEPFGSLDEVRRGNVLTLIRRLSGTFEQVLVISHVAETRDAVDHVIELDYDEAAGRSRVLAGATVATAAEVAA